MFNRFICLLSTSEEPSLFREIIDYLNDKFFSPSFSVYDNINFGSGTLISIKTIIFGFFIGVFLASIASILNKRVRGDFVRLLISENCNSPETAKTLSELGYYKNTFIRSSLKRGSAFNGIVRCVQKEIFTESEQKREAAYLAACEECKQNGEKKPQAPESVPFIMDLNTARFYIAEDDRIKAEIKFEKKGTNWLVLLFVFILSITMIFAIFMALPEIFQMLDNFISMFTVGHVS